MWLKHLEPNVYICHEGYFCGQKTMAKKARTNFAIVLFYLKAVTHFYLTRSSEKKPACKKKGEKKWRVKKILDGLLFLSVGKTILFTCANFFHPGRDDAVCTLCLNIFTVKSIFITVSLTSHQMFIAESFVWNVSHFISLNFDVSSNNHLSSKKPENIYIRLQEVTHKSCAMRYA